MISKLIKNKTFEYAILNQQYKKNESATNYEITWKDKDGVNLKIEKVNISSNTTDVNIKNTTEPKEHLHQHYFIKKNDIATLRTFNEIKNEATITPNTTQDNGIWTYQTVNDDLEPFGDEETITNKPLKSYHFIQKIILFI